VHLAEMIKGPDIEPLGNFIRYLDAQVRKAGVQVSLGEQVGLSVIQNLKPDVVILALGGIPLRRIYLEFLTRSIIWSPPQGQSALFLRWFGARFMRWAQRSGCHGKEIVIIGGAIQVPIG